MKRNLRLFPLLLCLAGLTWFAPPVPAQQKTAGPPVPESRPHRMEAHGDVREDPFFWLRDVEDPAVIAHLKAENAWTEQALAPVKDLRATLYAEMRGRIKEDDLSVPVEDGGYFYYTRTVADTEYYIEARRKGSMEGPEEIILDANERAKGRDYYELADYEMSPDHRIAALLENFDGTDVCTLRFREIPSGRFLDDEIPMVANGSAGLWAADGRTFFYLQPDDTQRAARLMRHTLGEKSDADVLVFDETDPAFTLNLYQSQDNAWLVLMSTTTETTECRILRADDPAGFWKVVEPRQDGLRYDVDHANGRFWMVTNADGATDRKLMSAPDATPDRAHWVDFFPYDPAVVLEGVEVFAEWMVLSTREKGLPCLRVADYDGTARKIEFPEAAYSLEAESNPRFAVDRYRFNYSSAVTPQSVIEIDGRTLKQTVLKRREVVGGYDPSAYLVERLEASASDGTRIPISLVRRRDTPLDGTAPLLLEGYGSYGLTSDPFFASSLLSLLDRGFIQATAHVRGGGEMGRAWYENGKLTRKPNTFTDFIACAEHLVAHRYTSADRLCASGGSAGGMLMSAVANLRPDLFRSIVANVPFVDCLNTMSDPTLPLTTSEYIEWGNPEVAADYRTILSYSPYDNVRPQAYPAILATTGLNDPRVPYWEPAKWIARLRSLNTGTRPVLLWTNLEAGHGGASGRFEYLEELAREYAFHLMGVGESWAVTLSGGMSEGSGATVMNHLARLV